MIDSTTSATHIGDCRSLLDQLPERCMQMCVTSPPYWGLRDYGHDGQLGLEPTPEAYVSALVGVFQRVRRVLKDDGTLWVNLGDSYAGGKCGRSDEDEEGLRRRCQEWGTAKTAKAGARGMQGKDRPVTDGLKPKDLVGIPWMVAFALRADGWYLRSDIIWAKSNPMPESVTDRPTKSHEYLFLLSKSERYFYDHKAIAERCEWADHNRNGVPDREDSVAPGQTVQSGIEGRRRRGNKPGNKPGSKYESMAQTDDHHRTCAGLSKIGAVEKRNKRSVWTVASQPYSGAHFATFPPKLIEPCILAGSRVGDMVLDPFMGSGTTGEVAERHGRRWMGFDLGYENLSAARTAQRSLVLP